MYIMYNSHNPDLATNNAQSLYVRTTKGIKSNYIYEYTINGLMSVDKKEKRIAGIR